MAKETAHTCEYINNTIEGIFELFIPQYNIMKTYLYNFDPLKPHFYIVKLGFTGVYVIFLISAQKHRLWYSARRF